MFTTTGGRQIFVKEVLGGAYDSQAEHFLRGDVDVDVDAIGHEAMIVNGKVRMYFGPFPALLRLPLNFIYPAGHGKWSRISGFCAGVIALFAFAGLMRTALCSSPLSSRAPDWLGNSPQGAAVSSPPKELSPSARNWLGNACVIGFALGSPLLLLLGNLSIYDEAIIWGFALSLGAIFFALESRKAEGSALTGALLGFSLCAGCALLSRVTFGAPFILIAPFLALAIRSENRIINLAALLLPLGAALAFYIWLSYARFGSPFGVNFDYYINPVHAEFAHKFGVFSPRRLPYSFADYFGLRFPALQSHPPFLAANRHSYNYPWLYSNDFSEVYLPLPWCSGWLVFAAIMGIIYLVRRNCADAFERGTALALFGQCLCILSYFLLAQRYAADFYPFLIFCLVIFLCSGGVALLRSRQLIIGLIALSILVNSLATISWLLDADQNVPPTTKASWEKLLGRHSFERRK
ncbi:MAG: hypothetical protein WAN04_04800 [Candidatus Udaeobacter sp.]